MLQPTFSIQKTQRVSKYFSSPKDVRTISPCAGASLEVFSSRYYRPNEHLQFLFNSTNKTARVPYPGIPYPQASLNKRGASQDQMKIISEICLYTLTYLKTFFNIHGGFSRRKLSRVYRAEIEGAKK